MDYENMLQTGSGVVLDGVRCFDLDETLDCGQSFRWVKEEGEDYAYSGIACGRLLRISQHNERIVFHGVSVVDFENIWMDYFDLRRDYHELKAFLSRDVNLENAVGFAGGIRVLRQEPWEALCTFILSQNNNIPRIKGLVSRLCEFFGDKIDGGFAFPPPERLAALSVGDLAPVRAGFRAKYIIDAARKASSGEVNLCGLSDVPLEQARQTLQKICGVGPKVAECTLLYGFARVECFPVDVWIKRALAEYYPEGFPKEFASVAGIAQQYLFHYIRNSGGREDKGTENRKKLPQLV